jgi:hypothetical protein
LTDVLVQAQVREILSQAERERVQEDDVARKMA